MAATPSPAFARYRGVNHSETGEADRTASWVVDGAALFPERGVTEPTGIAELAVMSLHTVNAPLQ